jgi:hypothetical protein
LLLQCLQALYINFKGTKADIANLNTKGKYIDEVLTPAENNGDGNIMIDAIAELTPKDCHSSQSWPTHRINETVSH